MGNKKCKLASGNNYILTYNVPAIIIYPSLVTPLIQIGKDTPLQIILLGKKKYPIGKENINLQLKITLGLKPEKLYLDEPLFSTPEEAEKNIEFKKNDFGNDHIKSGNFAGIIDHRFMKIFETYKQFNELYKVKITLNKNTFFKYQSVYNLIWMYPIYHTAITKDSIGRDAKVMETGYVRFNDAGNLCKNFPKNNREWKTTPLNQNIDKYYELNYLRKKDSVNYIVPNEHQDLFIEDVLNEMNGKGIKEKGKYGFVVDSVDVDPTRIDPLNPIQSYHPVFYYNKLDKANIALIGDPHVCSRQQILCGSNARVTEYKEEKNSRVREADTHISPLLGPKVNIHSANFKKQIDQIGKDKDIDFLFIAGDLIDYIKSSYQGDRIIKKAKDVWDAVELEGDKYTGYEDFVDYIAFYSLIVYFCKKYKKPVFIITGNHDCYYEPFGISPFAFWKKRNEGIPADNNLTIYEACLIFGKSCEFVPRGPILPKASFDSDKFRWYYTIFTPFSDFSIELPKQHFVFLGWGNDEDLIDIVQRQGSQFGHLGRAGDSISDKQLKILNPTLRKGKKVILVTHFTFISYMDNIPFFTKSSNGNVEFSTSRYKEFDLGTFQKNRERIYKDYFGNKKIQCVLSGHSHRRGLYTIEKILDHSVNVKQHFFTDFFRESAKFRENTKIEETHKKFDIYFQKNKPSKKELNGADIRNYLHNNAESLDGLENFLATHIKRHTKRDNSITITEATFELTGYASKPGKSKYNKALADRRSSAIKLWIKKRFSSSIFVMPEPKVYINDSVGENAIEAQTRNHRDFWLDRRVQVEIKLRGKRSTKHKHTEIKSSLKKDQTPYIIVTDSAGPLPRHNKYGEFNGWGSDYPSFVKILVNDDASVKLIKAIKTESTHCKPRFIVALDYLDYFGEIVENEKNLKNVFKTFYIAEAKEKRCSYWIRIIFADELKPFLKDRVEIEDIIIYGYPGVNKKIILKYAKTVVKNNEENIIWKIKSIQDAKLFYYFVSKNRGRGSFISIKFKLKEKNDEIFSHYNFDDYWNFEFKLVPKRSESGKLYYRLERYKPFLNKPDFRWREKNHANKYK